MTINPNPTLVEDAFEIDNGALTFERPVDREPGKTPETAPRENEPDVGDRADTGPGAERQGMQQVQWQQRNAVRRIAAWAQAH